MKRRMAIAAMSVGLLAVIMLPALAFAGEEVQTPSSKSYFTAGLALGSDWFQMINYSTETKKGWGFGLFPGLSARLYRGWSYYQLNLWALPVRTGYWGQNIRFEFLPGFYIGTLLSVTSEMYLDVGLGLPTLISFGLYLGPSEFPLFSTVKAKRKPYIVWSFELIEPIVSDKLAYENNKIGIRFKIPGKTSETSLKALFWPRSTSFPFQEIDFELENKTNRPLKILWDESTVMLPSGISDRVIHGGVKFFEMEKAQLFSLVPPGERWADRMAPTALCGWVSPLKKWEIEPMALFDEGEVGCYLTLEIKGEKVAYLFKFKAHKHIFTATK